MIGSAACVVVADRTGEPALAVVLVLGLALIPLVIRRQRLTLAVLAVVEVANLATIAADHGIPRVYVLLLTAAVLSLAYHWVRHDRGPVWSPVLWFAAAFFATRAVSIIAATDRAATVTSLVELAKGIVFFAVVLTLCVRTGSERLLAGTMVTTVAVLCLLELIQQFVLNNSTTFFGLSKGGTVVDVGLAVGRHSGPLDDHNFWGRILIMVAPLALSLFADRSAGRGRWWWFAGFLLVVAGVYLTGSRGALLITGAVVVAWCVLAGRRYRRRLLFAPVVAVLLLAVPGVGSRLASIGDVSTTAESQADESLIGRVQAQEAGLHMFLDHPAIGVGAGNFVVAEPEYLRDRGIDGQVLAPHDLYLEMAAESGLLGLAGWLGLFASGLFIALRAWLLTRRRTPAGEPSADWLLAGGVIAGLVGWGLNGILLHLSSFPTLALLFTIAIGLDRRARRAAASREGAVRWEPGMVTRHVVPRPARPGRPGLWVPAVVFAVVAGSGFLVPGVLTQQWSASVQLRVTPRTEADPPEAYSLAVASRPPVVLTYLALFGDENLLLRAASRLGLSPEQRAAVSVTASTSTSSSASLLTVTAVGPRSETARDMATEIADVVTTHVNGLRPLYQLERVPSATTPTETTVIRPAAFGVLLATAAALAALSWIPVRAAGTTYRTRNRRTSAI